MLANFDDVSSPTWKQAGLVAKALLDAVMRKAGGHLARGGDAPDPSDSSTGK
ncbi:hypothetical protein [Burkholderia ubonensis]|uniref:hypothetical protein n=1 Tax=Burkholderia ubonensis TaxID=101571 RepID=UPI0012FB463F|nr:hypothetical protein [Burkholderia ubonensis]